MREKNFAPNFERTEQYGTPGAAKQYGTPGAVRDTHISARRRVGVLFLSFSCFSFLAFLALYLAQQFPPKIILL
jgi:hypothetical protein